MLCSEDAIVTQGPEETVCILDMAHVAAVSRLPLNPVCCSRDQSNPRPPPRSGAITAAIFKTFIHATITHVSLWSPSYRSICAIVRYTRGQRLLEPAGHSLRAALRPRQHQARAKARQVDGGCRLGAHRQRKVHAHGVTRSQHLIHAHMHNFSGGNVTCRYEARMDVVAATQYARENCAKTSPPKVTVSCKPTVARGSTVSTTAMKGPAEYVPCTRDTTGQHMAWMALQGTGIAHQDQSCAANLAVSGHRKKLAWHSEICFSDKPCTLAVGKHITPTPRATIIVFTPLQ